ncbi:MAG TPA: methyltransferase domain-containing protein [Terriglobales bacterium]|nr:methyltransferase domain-containing protein [Terriglobales bacterium]
METNSSLINEEFFREYTSADAIAKYSRATAGSGISYLLDHDYKDVYLQALSLLPTDTLSQGIRVLEFGCGAGMNLVHLVAMMRQRGINVAAAVGTDFSPVLVGKARDEARNYLSPTDLDTIKFHVANNETLLADLAVALERSKETLKNSFHFILGVNTIRYSHAAKKQANTARDIFNLLAPGGVCVVIDMNNRFPLFRSDIRNSLRWNKVEQCYVPSLEEYAAPFAETGFELLRREHFCWIPHSAGGLRLGVMKAFSPILNVVAKSRAMRSLVIARKPVT